MFRLKPRKTALLGTFVAALVFGASVLPGAAQDVVTPVTIGGAVNGTIENAEVGDVFRLDTDLPQAVTLQVLSQTPGFAPKFRLMDGNGLVVQSADNASGQMILDRQIPLSTSNLYLEVGSANGTIGNYIVALQESTFAVGPTPLTLGQSVTGSTDNATPEAFFSFDAPVDQGAKLLVDSLTPTRGVVVSLRDGLSGELLALSNMRFGGVDFDILPASGSYFLEIMHSGTEAAEGFTVCYVGLNTQTTCGEVAQAPLACAVTPTGASVNIRSGNSTDFGIVGTLAAGASATVIGQSNGGGWVLIDFNGLNGWVAASVVTVTGDCAAVSVVATPVPPVVATQPPVVEPTDTPDAPTEEPNEGGNGGGIPAGPGDLSAGNDDSPDPTAPGTQFDIVLPSATATPTQQMGLSN
jgi:uncharacterized protein YraI